MDHAANYLKIRNALQGLLDEVDGLVRSSGREPEPTDSAAELRSLPARTVAIEYVLDLNCDRTEPTEPERPMGAMSPVQIWAYMQAAGRIEPKMEIQVTTYDLWKRGRIEKVSRGLYRAKRAGSFTFDEAFPRIAVIIDAVGDRTGAPVPRSNIVAELLAAPDNFIADAAAAQGRDPRVTAGNIVDWWSAEWTKGANPYAERYDRFIIAGEKAYLRSPLRAAS